MASKRTSRRDVPEALRVRPGSRFRLRDPDAARDFGWDKAQVELATAREPAADSASCSTRCIADGRFAMLVVLQAIDGGGKDSTIRRVFSAFNPQGCTVTSFKVPSAEEMRHDYLWRIHRHAPARGEIAVFNRSHYEDVLVVRVENLVPEAVWSQRYGQINAFEDHLAANGTRVVKIFLQISHEEQKRRFEERLADRAKQWKFDPRGSRQAGPLARLPAGVRGGNLPLQHGARPLVRRARGSQVVPRFRGVADHPPGTGAVATALAEAGIRSATGPHFLSGAGDGPPPRRRPRPGLAHGGVRGRPAAPVVRRVVRAGVATRAAHVVARVRAHARGHARATERPVRAPPAGRRSARSCRRGGGW